MSSWHRFGGIRWRIGLALVVLAGAITAPLAVWAGGQQSNPGSSGVSRVERVFGPKDWRCNIDGCPGHSLAVRMPADVATVDVVATVTLAYRLGRSESVRPTFGYATGPPPPIPCCGDPPSTPMRPDSYPLASPDGRATTTTLTWVAKDLPAAGGEYRLYFHLHPSGTATRAHTGKTTIVVETWAAGN